ncbi:hypothetical protein SapgrDRAFT_2311 [Saprospira grandis DSM 2844]|uniref:Uncharacterized protein n=1 Tax=Saprospira grandis DSM 2844 TaxID=694433 RepID=J0P2E8_9BACT|nr:hypothetical protein [Saprospira grandis]EJF53979.1 hypothetical protein SapgrDRAFT_2311 [Saprospira grandis DSM 2844]
MKHYIGIHISADEFHYCIPSTVKGNKIEPSCENNPVAIAQFIKRSIGLGTIRLCPLRKSIWLFVIKPYQDSFLSKHPYAQFSAQSIPQPPPKPQSLALQQKSSAAFSPLF